MRFYCAAPAIKRGWQFQLCSETRLFNKTPRCQMELTPGSEWSGAIILSDNELTATRWALLLRQRRWGRQGLQGGRSQMGAGTRAQQHTFWRPKNKRMSNFTVHVQQQCEKKGSPLATWTLQTVCKQREATVPLHFPFSVKILTSSI